MASRKNFLKKISPHKGTGRYLQYLRCPCCGKLARGQAIGSAGTHELSVSQCVGRRPGYRTGFDWEHQRPGREHLEALRESLERALVQVDAMLGEGVVIRPSVASEYHIMPVTELDLGVLAGAGLNLEVLYGYQDEGYQVQGQEADSGIIHPRVLPDFV